MNFAWFTLVIAGLLEVGWAVGLKSTDGFNFRGKPLACSLTLGAMILSMYLLSVAVRTLPIGTAYAIWTGIGALGAATLGMMFFREPATLARVACLAMIVFGIVGLKLTSAASAQETPKGDHVIPFYIGGYSGKENKGIYRATLNLDDGTLSKPTLAIEARDASFLALHPTLPILYAVGELGKVEGQPAGNVQALKIAADGTLIPDGQRLSQGDGPCYVSVDTAGRFVFVANYGDGVASAYPLAVDGSIGEKVLVDHHDGSSLVKGRQEGPHAHSFVPDPSGRFALCADLGTDEIVIYRIDTTAVARVGATKMPPGSGPRHIAFALDGKFVYICNELSNTMTTFAFDASAEPAKILTQLAEQSTLPADFKGESYCAEIAIHPSGRFLYVSNRGHDSLAVFKIDPATGSATLAGHVPTGGHWPRHFAVEPGGRFLIVANQRSDSLVSFKIDPDTGMPTPTGSTISAGGPSCVRLAR